MAFDAALIQNATITGFTNVNIQTGIVRRRQNYIPTTHSGSGTSAENTGGRHWLEANLFGYFNTGSAYPLPIGVTLSNGPLARIQRITLVKQQDLRNATGPGDANGTQCFTKGVVTYFGQGVGALADDDTPLETPTISLSSFTIPISTGYSVAANAIVTVQSDRFEFARGGHVVYPFSFVLTGTVTVNGTNNPFSLVEASVDATLANGKDLDGTVFVRTLQATIDYEAGTATPFQLQGPFDGAVTIGNTAA